MNRGKKILINIVIIIFLLFGYFFFEGYYISKDQCIKETLRTLYVNDIKYIMEVEEQDRIRTLYTDDKVETITVVGITKHGFFYKSSSSSGNLDIDKNYVADVISVSRNDKEGMFAFVYRNHPDVVKVEIYDQNRVIVVDEWTKDFAYVILSDDNHYIYKAYDINNQLIEEREILF